MTTLVDAGRIARRVLGGAHPTTVGIECDLGEAQAIYREHGGKVSKVSASTGRQVDACKTG